MGYGQLLKQGDEIPGKHDRTSSGAPATNHPAVRYDGYISHFCFFDTVVVTGRDTRNVVTRRSATQFLSQPGSFDHLLDTER